MRGRCKCNRRTVRGEARRQDGGVTRGQCNDRWLNNQLAQQEYKRAAGQDDECSQVYNSTYCSVNCQNDCCLILSPFNRGGVTISRPSLYFCISIFLGELRCRMPIRMKWLFNLCFGDTPCMHAFKSNFFASTSNVPVQLVVLNWLVWLEINLGVSYLVRFVSLDHSHTHTHTYCYFITIAPLDFVPNQAQMAAATTSR
jgi:hypothetical protein